MELPERFLTEMKTLLREEYGDFLDSYSQAIAVGLRVNTGKISVQEFKVRFPFPLTPVPWTENGFYAKPGAPLSRHPWYYAGLYYIQEPSAMLPAALLDVHPGERVLDLCAAPGGKATELGSRLKGEGLLVANDVSHSRAKALLKNLQLHGIGNLCVCSETPARLLDAYPAFFDKILADAPCSGEGMFRKEPSMIKSYLERGPEYYAPLQREILEKAVLMLKPGGKLVYSTCTFSRMENEQVLETLLKAHPEMECLKICRLFPHKVKGEGHFAALLQKCGETPDARQFSGTEKCGVKARKQPPLPKEWTKFARTALKTNFAGWDIFPVRERLYALPDESLFRTGMRFLDTGLFLGNCVHGRFEPSQALAMWLKKEEAASVFSLAADDPRVIRYLKGETVELTESETAQCGLQGWTLFCADGYPLGWTKWVDHSLRNKYYAGWRMN